MFRSLLSKLLPHDPVRISGRPPSGNGASSFHLYWDAPPVPLAEVRATIEVVEPPSVDKLYFWAVQVAFHSGSQRQGAAHFGLQYHPKYPGGAVNWGGYNPSGGILDGSESSLPSALDNRNTRNYQWHPGRRYCYRITRSPKRGWRGTITDLSSGEVTIVRDLWVEADSLSSPMIWTEAFADCDDRPAAVRWSDLEAITVSGDQHLVEAVRLNYQSYSDGGCSNTNTFVDPAGFVQRTSTERLAPTGTTLRLEPGPAAR